MLAFDSISSNSVASSAPSASITGSIAWTEAGDVMSITAGSALSASVGWTQANNVTSISGNSADNAVIGWTQASNGFSATAASNNLAIMSWTQDNQSTSITGTNGVDVSGVITWTEQGDTMSAYGETNGELAGYIAFLRNVAGIPISALPVNSPYIQQTYTIASELVLTCLKQMPDVYTWALYNLACHFLVCQCPDQPGQTYFSDMRTKFGTLNFTPGLIQASNDESTGQSWMIPDVFKRLNVRELAYLKTPWGQAYMGIAQMGYPLYGIS